MKKLIIAPLVIVAVSCASFRHTAIQYHDKSVGVLERLSKVGDAAVTSGLLSKLDRQRMARDYMLPAIQIEETINRALGVTHQLTPELVASFAELYQLLSKLVSDIITPLPASESRTNLLNTTNEALVILSQWQSSIK